MAQIQGKIVQCIGAVVDVEFPREHMPKVYDALKMDGSTLTLTASERLCVQVQLIRDGVSSPAADTCVP